jgi:hypothetical protein
MTEGCLILLVEREGVRAGLEIEPDVPEEMGSSAGCHPCRDPVASRELIEIALAHSGRII